MNQGELLERVYREMHDDIVDGVATGGSATTIVDTALSTYQANKFKNWIAFISRTTDGLTPQNKYAKVTTFVAATGTVSFATITDTVAVGDEYALCKGIIPIYTLAKRANDALKKLGRIENRDRSLTALADTRQYTMPIATKGITPSAVYLEDSEYNRVESPQWKILPAVGGSTETLQFFEDPEAGDNIVIEYQGLHPALTAYNSYVNETIHDELAVAAVLERAFWWKAMPKQRKIDMQNWGLAKQNLQEALMKYSIKRAISEDQRIPLGMFN